jgi:hypothetical protein
MPQECECQCDGNTNIEEIEDLSGRLESLLLKWAEKRPANCALNPIVDAVMDLFERMPMVGSLIEQRMEERLNHNRECLIAGKDIPLWGAKYEQRWRERRAQETQPTPEEQQAASEELADRLENLVVEWHDARNSATVIIEIAEAILSLIGRLAFVDTLIEMHFQDKNDPLPPQKNHYD